MNHSFVVYDSVFRKMIRSRASQWVWFYKPFRAFRGHFIISVPLALELQLAPVLAWPGTPVPAMTWHYMYSNDTSALIRFFFFNLL